MARLLILLLILKGLPINAASFVLWWDTQAEKSKGGRPMETRDRTVTGLVAGSDGLPDRMTISRWRKRLT